jgi:hypothetical protein
MAKDKLTLCIDFDGTCVKHEYPKVGDDIGAVPVLKRLVAEGHKLILWTMRCDSGVKSGKFNSGLTDALNWFTQNGIPLYSAQRNPTQNAWTQSPKCYAEVYIDDAALGCPLIYDDVISGVGRAYVDWKAVEKMLEEKGILTNKSL